MLTIEEARKMRGTEFTYFFGKSGESIPGFIKEFDPEIGFTCVSLQLKTNMGTEFPDTEGDGTCCIVAYNFKESSDFTLEDALLDISLIERTGALNSEFRSSFMFPISPICAFS